MTRWLLYLWAGWNVLTFIAYGLDKWKARNSRWRIPEATLMWMAALGGSLAALLAMNLFCHKTQHKKFRYGIPAILLVQIAAVIAVLQLL